MRRVSAVEAAALAAVGGCVLFAALPAFVSNLAASRLAEPVDGLGRIASRASALAAGRAARSAYPEGVGLTPPEVPRGAPARDPPGTWNHPTWRLLGFELTEPHSYGFSFESRNGPAESRFVARAHGDLDGDGIRSTFELGGDVREGSEPALGPLFVHREVE